MPANHLYLLLFAAAIIVAIVFLWFLWRSFGSIQAETNTQLFEQDKRAFFGQLDLAVRSHLMVLPSLPVGDVIYCSRWGRAGAITTSSKDYRFDFVLYHRRKMKVCCAINLIPYKTNANAKEFSVLRQLCEAIELPLLEYEMKPWRDVGELRRAVFAACNIVEQGSPEVEIRAEEPQPDPLCPKCHNSMTLRTLQRGVQAGQRWWVCNHYPHCNGGRPAKSV